MKHIIITGTPGTGKTTFAKRFASEYKLSYVDVSKLIKEKGLSEGYDNDKDCVIIDPSVLVKELQALTKVSVIDSHLSHHLPKDFVKICFVTRCELKELKKRLESRGYKDQKVRENLDSEIFDICGQEAREYGHKVVEVWTDKDILYGELEKFI